MSQQQQPSQSQREGGRSGSRPHRGGGQQPNRRNGARTLSQDQGHQTRTNQSQNRRSTRRDDVKDEKNGKDERRAFVPWLGEAKPKRGPIIDFDEKVGKKITVEFLNGRVIEGTLESYDHFANMVLNDTVEFLDNGKSRKLGQVFTRGRIEALGSQ